MIKETQPTQYFAPSERKAIMNSGVILSNQELDLATQVEKQLYANGVIVPGSVHDVPDQSFKHKIKSLFSGCLNK